ncbi:hypothetical protein ACRAWF_20680 [Streptomyces sp. L7]
MTTAVTDLNLPAPTAVAPSFPPPAYTDCRPQSRRRHPCRAP